MQINLKRVKIPLSRIKEDDTFFDFSDKNFLQIEKLKLSVMQIGIIAPLVVQHLSSGFYRIVDGFKRFKVAKHLKLDFIPAFLLEKNLCPRLVAGVFLFSNLRFFSLTEKARILKIMVKLGLSHDEIIENFGHLLELSSPELIDDYLKITDYPASVLSYISLHGLSLRQALALQELSLQEQETFVLIAKSLSLKGYDFHNILTDLKEIAIREGKDVKSVIEELGLLRIAEEKNFTRSLKIEKIKNLVREKRYPQLTDINRRLLALRKKMSFPEGTGLSWDRNLEGEIKIFFSLKSIEKFKNLVEKVLSGENLILLSDFVRVYYEGTQDRKGDSGQEGGG